MPAQRHLFEVPADVAYLNCAGLAPQLRSVRAAGERALARRAAPWTIGPADWFDGVERLRSLFARLIGAAADGVALVPATSYGLAVAARNVEATPGGRVLLLADDFPSNLHTWRAWARRGGAEVLTVRRAGGQRWTDAVLDALDERVRVVSVPSVHWTDGAVLDLARVGARAREAGALLAVDATQSLGAVPLDLAEVRPDYLVAAGYKWLLGPLGVSYLYVADEHRSGQPLEENWVNRAGAEDFAGSTAGGDDYRPGARRFDVGQRSNFVLIPMALAALEQLLEWGVERIAADLPLITGRIEAEAQARGLDALPAGERGPHLLGIRLPAERGSGVRERLAAGNVFVEMLGSVLRVSPHLHATDRDVDRLFAALDLALAETPR
ncbi:MAG: aminotransferase class V-fold PLP-dependent enzyme [Thermoleophilaceae bacterium]